MKKYVEPLRAELERWRSGQRRRSWPVVESVPDGMAFAGALVRAQGTEGGDEHDLLLREAAVRLRDLSDVAGQLLALRDRERLSRQAWAEEAMRLDHECDVALGAEGAALALLADAEDEASQKVECPSVVCAYSFAGEERAQQLVDHWVTDHAVFPSGGAE